MFTNLHAGLTGDAASVARLDAWATATRGRFTLLIAEPDVRRIIYALGAPPAKPDPALPEVTIGWAGALLTGSRYDNPAGMSIVLPAGAWGAGAHPKMACNNVRDTHVHLDLR